MRVLVAGGNGFCGWPTALYLSAWDHEVRIVDNFSRGRDQGLIPESLTETFNPKAWRQSRYT